MYRVKTPYTITLINQKRLTKIGYKMDKKNLKFYYGCASGSSRKALRELNEPNVMINYATLLNKPWDGIKSLFIDSGGYSFIKGKGEYETSNEEYLKFIEKQNPDKFALRDYPCEPDLLRKHNRTINQHQEMTLKKHIELIEKLEEYNITSQPVSVLQGWDIQDYIRCIDRYKEEGLLIKYVGIGSVCRRGKSNVIKDIILKIAEEVPSKVKIHGFGIKSNVLKFDEVLEKIDSADSMAYEFSTRMRMRKKGKGRTWKDVAYDYKKFKNKINNYIN